MPNNYVPSGWDYAGQAFSSAAKGIDDIRAQRELKRKEEEAKKMTMLQMVLGQYNQNNMGGDQLNAAATAAGMPMQVGPNQLDRRNMILSSPEGKWNPESTQLPQANIPTSMPSMEVLQQMMGVGGQAAPQVAQVGGAIPSMGIGDKPQGGMFQLPKADLAAPQKLTPWTDNEQKAAGLPTEFEKLKAQFDKLELDARTGVAEGRTLSDAQYRMLGMTNPKQDAAKEAATIDPVMEGIARRYVASAETRLPGGKLTRENQQKAIDLAVEELNKEREQSKFVQLYGEELKTIRSYMAPVIQARLGELDKAATAQLLASARLEGADKTPVFNIQTAVRGIDNKYANLVKQYPMLSMLGIKGKDGKVVPTPSQLAYPKAQLDLLNQQKAILQEAQVKYGGNIEALPPERKAVLYQSVPLDAMNQPMQSEVPDLGPLFQQAMTEMQNLTPAQQLAKINAKVKARRLNETDAARMKANLGIK